MRIGLYFWQGSILVRYHLGRAITMLRSLVSAATRSLPVVKQFALDAVEIVTLRFSFEGNSVLEIVVWSLDDRLIRASYINTEKEIRENPLYKDLNIPTNLRVDDPSIFAATEGGPIPWL